MSTLKLLAIIGGGGLGISALVIVLLEFVSAVAAPTTKCSYVYGTKTREYALCVFEMKETHV